MMHTIETSHKHEHANIRQHTPKLLANPHFSYVILSLFINSHTITGAKEDSTPPYTKCPYTLYLILNNLGSYSPIHAKVFFSALPVTHISVTRGKAGLWKRRDLSKVEVNCHNADFFRLWGKCVGKSCNMINLEGKHLFLSITYT